MYVYICHYSVQGNSLSWAGGTKPCCSKTCRILTCELVIVHTFSTWLTWGTNFVMKKYETPKLSKMIPNSFARFYSLQGFHNCTVMPSFLPSQWGTDPWHVKWRWMKADLRNEDVDLSVLPGQVPFPGIPETCKLRRQKRSRVVVSVLWSSNRLSRSQCWNISSAPCQGFLLSKYSLALCTRSWKDSDAIN